MNQELLYNFFTAILLPELPGSLKFNKMKKHIFWMIIGCGLPLLLIFFAPVLGIGSNASILIFILAMFACHLLMPMHGHGTHKHPDATGKDDQQNPATLKTGTHEHHH